MGECLSDRHLPHQTEPRHQYINTEDRPDITMFDPNTGPNLDIIDVSLAHPWSQDIIRRASKENGRADTTREEKKMKKYLEELVQEGYVSKLCFSYDRTFWEVGHKGRVYIF